MNNNNYQFDSVELTSSNSVIQNNTRFTRENHREFDMNPYKPNNTGKECCICLEKTSRLIDCDKCNDGSMCKSCFKKNSNIKDFVYNNSSCLCDARSLLLFTTKCPICRDYKAEDLDHSIRVRYEFTDREMSDKMLDFNINRLEEFYNNTNDDGDIYNSDEDSIRPLTQYNSEVETDDDEEDEGICLEDYINETIDIPSIHGLIGNDRKKEADRQARYIDIIQNVYPLNILFNEHFLYSDY